MPQQPVEANERAGISSVDWATIGAIVGLLVAGVAGVIWYRRSRRLRIYIVRIPYGEAPEHVRQAWVGLELPVVADQKRPTMLEAAGVRTGREQESVFGYAVEGKAAIQLLEGQDPAAAAWWRENVPEVVTSEFRFGFAAGDCRRV